ncbi:hypothetical protein GCK32_022803 [Trichostrongylus colubriformis]|uniref:Uncharacterized protein n=1 Tax=Trichostrongylus colubriformis TaxID=6319 RepID=A0AAN8IN74_TRICO
MLHKKYNDNSKLVSALQTRLENAKADRPTIQGQRRLLEYTIPIVTQLRKLKIHLDGTYPVQKVLAKFTPPIQRQVLEHYLPHTTEDSDWKMQEASDAEEWTPRTCLYSGRSIATLRLNTLGRLI